MVQDCRGRLQTEFASLGLWHAFVIHGLLGDVVEIHTGLTL